MTRCEYGTNYTKMASDIVRMIVDFHMRKLVNYDMRKENYKINGHIQMYRDFNDDGFFLDIPYPDLRCAWRPGVNSLRLNIDIYIDINTAVWHGMMDENSIIDPFFYNTEPTKSIKRIAVNLYSDEYWDDVVDVVSSLAQFLEEHEVQKIEYSDLFDLKKAPHFVRRSEADHPVLKDFNIKNDKSTTPNRYTYMAGDIVEMIKDFNVRNTTIFFAQRYKDEACVCDGHIDLRHNYDGDAYLSIVPDVYDVYPHVYGGWPVDPSGLAAKIDNLDAILFLSESDGRDISSDELEFSAENFLKDMQNEKNWIDEQGKKYNYWDREKDSIAKFLEENQVQKIKYSDLFDLNKADYPKYFSLNTDVLI